MEEIHRQTCPPGLLAKMARQEMISNRDYLGMYTPAPRLARLLWATRVLRYTSLVIRFLIFMFAEEASMSLLPFRTTSFTSYLGSSPANGRRLGLTPSQCWIMMIGSQGNVAWAEGTLPEPWNGIGCASSAPRV